MTPLAVWTFPTYGGRSQELGFPNIFPETITNGLLQNTEFWGENAFLRATHNVTVEVVGIVGQFDMAPLLSL